MTPVLGGGTFASALNGATREASGLRCRGLGTMVEGRTAMSRTPSSRSGRAIAAYAVIMTVCGVGAALVTYGLTGSVWWAVIVLLVAGPVVQTVLRGVWSP